MIENENDGDDFLHGAFNTKVSSTTKFSPFHLQRLVINTATIIQCMQQGEKITCSFKFQPLVQPAK